MKPGRQLPVNEQRLRLRAYLHTLRANYNRASRELFSTSRIRRGCPLERNLRYQRFTDAYELLQLAEKSLKELDHCYVLRIAGFRPGAHVLVTTTLKGFPPSPRRYIVLDVIWAKGDRYYYEAQELTKTGAPHRGRYPTWLSPSNRISIEYCEEPLSVEATTLANARVATSKWLLDSVLQKGEPALRKEKSTVQQVTQSRQYPFWLRQ